MDPVSADAVNFGVQLVKKFVVNDVIGQCTKDPISSPVLSHKLPFQRYKQIIDLPGRLH